MYEQYEMSLIIATTNFITLASFKSHRNITFYTVNIPFSRVSYPVVHNIGRRVHFFKAPILGRGREGRQIYLSRR